MAKKTRVLSVEGFRDWELPALNDEEWKYTNLQPMTKHTYHSNTQPNDIDQKILTAYCQKDDINIIFINGIFSKEHSNLKDLPNGIKITTFQKTVNANPHFNKYLSKNDTNKTSFISLNQSLSEGGISIEVEDKIVSEKLIHIFHITGSSKHTPITSERSLISIGQSSEITILENHIGLNDNAIYFSNPLTDIILEKNAALHYCKIQKESQKAFHIGHTRVWQENSSVFDGFSLSIGGELTRQNLDIALNGEGAEATLNGLYCANGSQHIDNHTKVDHRALHGTSRQLYKGILDGSSRAVFNGKVIVRSEAQLTNSYQLNKNLLLGNDCRVDTKPQLEIFADDVKCTHGATIGQINEDELFYLQSRGIAKEDAIRMICQGFIDDLLNTISHKGIQQKLKLLFENHK